MEMINDRFIRRQSVAWTNMFRNAIDFVVVGTQVIKFGEFLKKIPQPSSLNVFHMSPLRGSALYVMDAFLVYLIIDYFFGDEIDGFDCEARGGDLQEIRQSIEVICRFGREQPSRHAFLRSACANSLAFGFGASAPRTRLRR